MLKKIIRTIAFFDFDGTITKKDSFSDFIKFSIGKPAYFLGLFFQSPFLAAYKLRIIPNYIAKEMLFCHFFKGWELSNFQTIADNYSKERIDKITRPKAIDRIKWHKEQGHKVVIVTASIECWLRNWCRENELDLIATRIEVNNGILTGKFSSKNCYSSEKADRILGEYDISSYDSVFAYGDSKGDKEMLDLADEKFFKYFE
jgi:phosphatidylglycerophosphatase C